MPWQMGWPPYVSQRVIDDRRRATEELERASDDLRDSVERAKRTARVADALARVRTRNHFSESMEQLFATNRQGKTS